MNWEEKIAELNEYDISFEIKQGYYHITLKYKDYWEILQPDNDAIYVEKRDGVCHYLGQTQSVSIEELFKTIDETIEYNKDAERKLELFKEKVEELQQLFATENYEILKTLQFKVTKKKKKSAVIEKTEDTNKVENEEEAIIEEKPIDTKKKKVRKTKKEQKKNVEEVISGNTQIQEEDLSENTSFFEDDGVITMTNNTFMEELER